MKIFKKAALFIDSALRGLVAGVVLFATGAALAAAFIGIVLALVYIYIQAATL